MKTVEIEELLKMNGGKQVKSVQMWLMNLLLCQTISRHYNY